MSGGPRPTRGRLAAGLAALAILIAATLLLRQIEAVGGLHGSPLFSLGFLVIGGAVVGDLAAFVGLPRLTGYLIAGVLAGPQGGAILAVEDVKALSLINVLALALISLQAGAELTVALLQRTWRSVLWSVAVQSVLVVAPMALVFHALTGWMPFLDGLGTGPLLAVSLVWGVVAVTRSPAVTLAILSETGARGPLAQHALGVAVLLDVIVLPLFAGAIAIATGQIGGLDFDAAVFVRLGRELFASVCAGTSIGLALSVLLRFVQQDRILMLVVVGYGVTALVQWLRYDTMLVFRVAGFVVMNLTAWGRDLIQVSERLGAAVMVVFFATAGAKMDLHALRALWPVALGLFATRILMSWGSAQVAHRLARDPPVVRRYAITSLVSQAGVTIGLATIVADALPGVGKALATLIIAVVGLNELAGPVIFTWGLKKAGELPGDASGHGEVPAPTTSIPAPH